MDPINTIYTIGHSTHPIDVFIHMVLSFKVEVVADIRRFPGSRKYPQFNSDALAASLQEAGIGYQHMPELGGRRKPLPDSKNTAWRNDAFRGYADYGNGRLQQCSSTAGGTWQDTANSLHVLGSRMVAMPPCTGIRLPEGGWLAGIAHHGCRQSHRTSIHSAWTGSSGKTILENVGTRRGAP